MSALLIATAVVAWLALQCWTFYRAVEDESRKWLAASAAVLVFGIAACIYGAQKEGEQGPCLREEQGWMYNAALKSMQPYTYCAERGTWVEE